ncbi:MAG: helix-turn-helix transcriptional regulator [Anaerolineae bacterium]
MAVTTARQKVLAYLQKHRSASAREIARTLEMTAANVRHHLSILLADGRVEVSARRQGEKRGRPEKVYSLAQAMLGNNLPALAAALLEEWLGKMPESERPEALRVLAKHMAEPIVASAASGPLTKRLIRLVEHLNQAHYHARWEAGAEGPRIVLTHCPYAAIIEKHPELCQMDAALLSEGMHLPARQAARMGRQGAPACVFLLG